MKLFYTISFLLLFCCILTHSDISVFYAFTGLELWYSKMIPTLLPFMILSGIMVRMKLTEGFTTLVYPLLYPLFRVSQNVCYGMLMGFLCGFPMGAKTVADLRLRNMISQEEAQYLLSFCNNIGPVYFISFVLPLLKRRLILPYVAGMYGIPLAYGLFLRYTRYRFLPTPSQKQAPKAIALSAAQLLEHLDASIHSAVQSILMLGGYMILFNMLNLLPHLLLGRAPILTAPLLEITGGLKLLQDKMPLYTLLLLPLGGCSCIAQTYSCIRDTSLSLRSYILQKGILTALTAVYYSCWLLLSPSSFLR